MKIGILTYHRSHNYGALLQAIALRDVLVGLGHEVSFVDYWPGYHRRMYAIINVRRLFNLLHPLSNAKYFAKSLRTWKSKNKRIRNVGNFIEQNIVPYCSTQTDKYDVVVCGSDQIWRKQPENFGYNPVYFGKNNIDAAKQISYAASMGVLPASNDDKETIKYLVNNLESISVRENNLRDLLLQLGFQNVHVSIDPTLLLNAAKWNDVVAPKRLVSGKYALFYEVAQNVFDEKMMKTFCDANMLKLVILRTKMIRNESESEKCSCPPDHFVNLIRFADFVFTSSFHGLAFSIINHKQFLCSASERRGRLLSLMENLCITGHFIEPNSQIPAIVPYIDYDSVDAKLNVLREESFEYLKGAI